MMKMIRENVAKSSGGFTLIELLVSVTVAGILMGGGIVAYNNFNQKQRLIAAGRNLVMDLQDTQKRAQSGEKSCNSGDLNGWGLTRASNSSYRIQALCTSGGNVELKTVVLGSGITLGSFASVEYQVNTGRLRSNNDVTIDVSDNVDTYRIVVTGGGAVEDRGLQ